MKKRVPYFLQIVGLLAAVFAFGGILLSAGKLYSMMQARAYEDCGITEFVAAEWYTKTEYVRRQASVPAHTRYHYYVRYVSVDRSNSSYSYHEKASSYEKARDIADSKVSIKRRVLSDGDDYITIPADQTKNQWLLQSSLTYFVIILLSAAYLVFFIILTIKSKRK